ncbi:polyphosphate polymerase domain-containing protein [Shewanella submarina]|uniref:Polyphosphate polymerase domain-containing protein n=1 Tax=Shewanella submarina TaxID=2016376 RepID=A0ABV7G935_9GAMM|nr:polyphosphate polymerase domain-containing protein [Shewanella submarina]MCL1038557.1 polyphosphate polymerase domain-containing protein [Shewanella submarina]
MTHSRRFEVKIPIPLNRLSEVLVWLRSHPALFKCQHAPRYVNSLYLDTADLDRFEENLSGISHRRKVRIRWYQELTAADRATLEFKHREAGKGYKVSFPTSLPLSQPDFSWHRVLQTCYRTLDENGRQLWGPELNPVLICRYQREYFCSADGHIRATLDREMQVFDQRYQRRANLSKARSLGDYVLLELKADETFETQLSDIISSCPLRPSRHSKYVNGIRNLFFG